MLIAVELLTRLLTQEMDRLVIQVMAFHEKCSTKSRLGWGVMDLDGGFVSVTIVARDGQRSKK